MVMLLENLLYSRTRSILDYYISQFMIKDDISRICTYNLLGLKLVYIYIRYLRAFSGYLLSKVILFYTPIYLPFSYITTILLLFLL